MLVRIEAINGGRCSVIVGQVNQIKGMWWWVAISIYLLGAPLAVAEEIRIAVASNFAEPLRLLSQQFEQQSGHRMVLVVGSTGKHYAQILHGAPFDAFFAADRRRPELLEQSGAAVTGSRFTYAVGRVVLWSPQDDLVDSAAEVLDRGGFRYLAIANPKLAPYGRAAEEILRARGQWKRLRRQMVRGENIGQAYQFVKSGNAPLGFVAYSQLKRPGVPIEGSWWEPPQSLYRPIEQQAVLLSQKDAARQFFSFMQQELARKQIESFGYGSAL